MNMVNRRVWMAVIIAGPLFLGLTSCDAVSPSSNHGDEEYACIETENELSGLDAPLPDGRSVRDLVGATLGTHRFVFTTPDTQKKVTTYTPQSNGVKGEMEIRFDVGKVRYIEAKRPQIPKGLQLDVYCPNRLEVEVSMMLRSEDGAFAESVKGVLHRQLNAAQNQDVVEPELARQIRLSVDFAQQPIAGSFKIATPSDFTPANTQSHRLMFDVLWEDDSDIREADLTAGWVSKPKEESPGETSQFATQMEIYQLDFAPRP